MTVATVLYAISLLTVTISMCQAVEVNFERNATESVTCAAGNFTIEEKASVTCHFNSDLKTTKQNFNVVKYPLKTSDESAGAETYILLCNWDSAGDLACKVEDGYLFSREVSTELTLTIPKVTLESEGLYVCQIVPTNGVQTETCTLRIITEENNDSQGPDDTFILIASLSTVSAVSVCLLIICCACCGYILNKCYLVSKVKKTTHVQDTPDNRTPPAVGNNMELGVQNALIPQTHVEVEPKTTCCGQGLIYKGSYKEGVRGGQKIIYLNTFTLMVNKEIQTDEKTGEDQAAKPSLIQQAVNVFRPKKS